MPLHDFKCVKCKHVQEELVSNSEESPRCDACGAKTEKVFLKSATPLKTIIPIYPGCKKHKAGYQHTKHADHPATKVQSGYGGCGNPS
jgi:putative FmdB family regulatory protein